MIYLDHNATTPLAPEAFAAMEPYLTRFFGNPSSIHREGREARAGIDEARDRLAGVLGAKSHEIIFTGGGTEADNLAVIGLAHALAAKGRHLITAATEHHAVLHAFEHLRSAEGFEITVLPVDAAGLVELEALRTAIREDTTLVSIMSANNETGTIQPIADLAALCHERDVLFHSDMVQSFGKEAVDVRTAGPDAISLAAHKFYGPKGVGALWLRSGMSIRRLQHGGSHENERRPGTENVAAIVGMARAAEMAVEGIACEQLRLRQLRERLWDGIHVLSTAAIRNGEPERCLANTLNVSFPALDGEALLINLDLEGVCASSGSACMVGSIQPSHVLLAMGVPAAIAQATVRFSFGKSNSETEIDSTVAALSRILSRLSPAHA